MKTIFTVAFALFMMSTIMRAQAPVPISLHDAVTLGLSLNPEILQGTQQIKAAAGKVMQAGKVPNPELGIAINEVPSGYKIGSANEKDISITQSFEYPAKRETRIARASLDEQWIATAVEHRKIQLSARIEKAYIDAQRAKISLNIIEEQISLLGDIQRIVSNRYASGEAKYLDVLRIEIEATRLRNTLLDAKNELRSSLMILKNAVGDSSVSLYYPSDTLQYVPFVVDQDSLTASSTSRSNARRMAELQMKQQETSLSLARSNYYPDFGVGLAYQRRTPANSFLGIEMKVSVPLWFWYEPQGLVEEASAQLSISQLNMMSVDRRIRNNIAMSIAMVQSTEQQVKNYEQVLQQGLKEILDVATSQYRNNQIDLLNLFDTYRTQREIRGEYYRAIASYRHAVVDLGTAAELSMEQ